MSQQRAGRWARRGRLSREVCCLYRRDTSASETAHLATCFWFLVSSVNLRHVAICRAKIAALLGQIAATITVAEEAEYGFDQTLHFDRGCCGSGSSRRTALVRPADREGGQVLRKRFGSHLLRRDRFRLPSLAASGRWTERNDWLLHRQLAV